MTPPTRATAKNDATKAAELGSISATRRAALEAHGDNFGPLKQAGIREGMPLFNNHRSLAGFSGNGIKCFRHQTCHGSFPWISEMSEPTLSNVEGVSSVSSMVMSNSSSRADTSRRASNESQPMPEPYSRV